MVEQIPLFSQALSVTDLTRYLRSLLESDEILRDVWVSGEISNLSRPSSGHVYLTLKDSGAALRCVIWRSTMLRLRIDLQNGMAVEAHGQVSLYERDGQYQLYIDALRPAGEGRLYQEFIRLKARLEAEGLFTEERKRPLPEHPYRIGIVTSPTGAALQDMLNTLARRNPMVEVVLAPAAVQGEEAPGEIVRALAALNRFEGVELILVARGGGSLEDLWAFNDERVVRAIAASSVPVISGIGHETDFTLADFAADRRAPTPTGAAVLAVPDIADVRAGLGNAIDRLNASLQRILNSRKNDLDNLAAQLGRVSPTRRLRDEQQGLDQLQIRLGRAALLGMQLRRVRLTAQAARLASLSPAAVMQRGYALVRAQDGALVRRAAQLSVGQTVRILMVDGQAESSISIIELK